MQPIKAPFPYFGGKSTVAAEVWRRFGNVRNYVEPFAGSLAVLLARPQPFEGVETVNDLDAMIANFWRAMTIEPDAVAGFADWPVNEVDLHARNLYLGRLRESLSSRLMADPDFFDAKAAGWWVWGISASIGDNFASGKGPWTEIDGHFVKGNAGEGIKRGLPRLSGNAGIHRTLPHLSDAGTGVHRKLPRLGDLGTGVHRSSGGGVHEQLQPVAIRLRRVRVTCGDWARVLGPSVTTKHGLTGVFLDPPYADGHETYANHDRTIFQDVTAWALENGNNELMRIAVCGYAGDHDELTDAGWSAYRWKANGGYGNQGDADGRANATRETIWFSPHCLAADRSGENLDLFG